jgi:hypothetical protein
MLILYVRYIGNRFPAGFSRSNRETEPSCSEAERRSRTASNDARIRLSLVRLGAQKGPQTRAISHCAVLKTLAVMCAVGCNEMPESSI